MKRKLTLLSAVVVAAAIGFWAYRHFTAEAALVYRFATVERGDLEATVSATGALSAVTTVEVGTQVSGRIVEIFADFNDSVKEGELIARIDPILQQQAVRDAQAGLDRARAELAQAEREYERNKQLFERKVLTEIEFNNAQYALEIARAGVKSALVSLDRAEQNLAYTSIYAPIDGLVVERTVDVGQTVAASYSTPKLFTIANDLAQMQILASVDESDIGAIHDAQPVRFSVQAYPNEQFTGTVKQVRLQSTTTENVVNYTVVVSVENPTGRLLPGMTATVDFLTGTASDVLMVPNAAVRFRPNEAMVAALRRNGGGNGPASRQAPSGAGSEPSASPAGTDAPDGGSAVVPPGSSGAAGAEGKRRRRNGTMLWYVDDAGRLAVVPVRTGLTDGQHTEVSGPGLEAGMQVIIGVTQPVGTQGSNPFPGPGGGGTRFRMGF